MLRNQKTMMTVEEHETQSHRGACRQILSFYDIDCDVDSVLGCVDGDKAGAPDITEWLGVLEAHALGLQYVEVGDVSRIAVCPVLIIYHDMRIRAVLPGQALPEHLEHAKHIVYVFKDHDDDGYARGSMRWFWGVIFQHWHAYAHVMVATFFINVLALAIPLYTMNVYDRVVPIFSEDTLFVLTVGVVVALVFDLVFKLMRATILENASFSVGRVYDYSLLNHLLRLPMHKTGLSVGETVNLFKELQGLKDYYASRMAPTIVDFPFFVLFIFVIYMISPILAMVPLCAAIIVFIVNVLVQFPINHTSKTYFAAVQGRSSLLIEILRGAETLNAQNAGGHYLYQWRAMLDHGVNALKFSQIFSNLAHNFSLLVIQSVTVFVLCLGVYEIQSGALTIGGLIAVSILSGRAVTPVLNISAVLSKMSQSRDILSSLGRLYALARENDGRATALYDVRGEIRAENVAFAYSRVPENRGNSGGEHNVLDDLSFLVNAREKVAVIGPNGAGKTSLLRLFAGHVFPSQGRLVIDSSDYQDVRIDSLRTHIGYVPQESFFFRGSVRSNIMLGARVDDAAFQNALVRSGLTIFLKSPDFSLEKDVGEEGRFLSGGQKQAIALARVFLRDPAVIIMDEPTNGVDSALEKHFCDLFDGYLKDKTVIFATHRINLLSYVQKTLVLHQGRVAGFGPTDEVLSKLQIGRSAHDGRYDA